jgi:hypothetical protein
VQLQQNANPPTRDRLTMARFAIACFVVMLLVIKNASAEFDDDKTDMKYTAAFAEVKNHLWSVRKYEEDGIASSETRDAFDAELVKAVSCGYKPPGMEMMQIVNLWNTMRACPRCATTSSGATSYVLVRTRLMRTRELLTYADDFDDAMASTVATGYVPSATEAREILKLFQS